MTCTAQHIEVRTAMRGTADVCAQPEQARNIKPGTRPGVL
jgi:hypothetical protein